MTIPNLRTPGFYSEVNTNTQRGGLPANKHKVLFITPDSRNDDSNSSMPVAVYDKAGADAVYGVDSIAGRMMTAAIKTNRFVNVEVLGVDESGELNPPQQV